MKFSQKNIKSLGWNTDTPLVWSHNVYVEGVYKEGELPTNKVQKNHMEDKNTGFSHSILQILALKRSPLFGWNIFR